MTSSNDIITKVTIALEERDAEISQVSNRVAELLASNTSLNQRIADMQRDFEAAEQANNSSIAAQIANAVSTVQQDLIALQNSLQEAVAREQAALLEITRLNAAIDAAQNQ
jgi:molecular chaperone GrpE (heat shock protein)